MLGNLRFCHDVHRLKAWLKHRIFVALNEIQVMDNGVGHLIISFSIFCLNCIQCNENPTSKTSRESRESILKQE